MLPKLPGHAARVIQTVQAAGGRVYLVGGALRDTLLAIPPKHWRFATSLTVEQLLALFPGSRPAADGRAAVYAYFVDSAFQPYRDWTFEIGPFRPAPAAKTKAARNAPLPDILGELCSQDFTVHAMAYDSRFLFDPFGAQRDLRMRLLRCVGRPEDCFAADPLRAMQLFRLAAQLGFTAEWNTFCAAGDAMELLGGLPREKVLIELQDILFSEGPQVLSGIVVKGGLRSYGFGFAPSLSVLCDVPNTPLCRWWALIALCGAEVRRVAKAFGFPRAFAKELDTVAALYHKGPAQNNVTLKQKLRGAQLDYAPIAATFAAVSPAFTAEPAIFASVCAKHEPYRLEDLAVDSEMLAGEGIRGRHQGQVLDELLGAVIKNPALNKPHVLLGLARSMKKLL